MKSVQNLKEKLKNLGLEIAEKAKSGYKTARDSLEQNLLNDSLRRRFNLENPYKFIIMDSMEKTSFINEILPKHAKRYNEDDIFIFYGSISDNDIKEGYIIKDLSDETLYKVKEITMVKVTVTFENNDYEVDGTAAYGTML
ncbi:MAG: hypothetical protein RQ856_02980 [Candidatus Izemoplasmatales bacterium]|nr:hypothetical protein [Candidatus Izemoplasmatales bacterium]